MKTFTRYRAFLAAAAVIACGATLLAQSESASPPLQFGGFDNHGTGTLGYRFTDVSGYEPQFQQMFGLESGFRVHDLNLFGQSHEKTSSFIDRYDFSASGIGGDPFSFAQLKASKSGVFELNVRWRQSHYYWNQNDNVALPISSVAPAFTSGLTTNHDWATVRKLGSADFTVHATRNLRFTFEAEGTSNDGDTFTTRSLDFFNAPAYWAAFARSNPYYLYAPVHDTSNRVAGGLSYTWRSWNFDYKVSHYNLHEDATLNNVAVDQVSINPVLLSQSQPLANLSWSQNRRLSGPGSEFSFVGQPTARLTWRGSYFYFRYRGPASIDEAENGIAPGSNGALTPYTISEGVRATLEEPSHVVSQGFTYAIRPWWDVDVDYRYTRISSNAESTVQSLFNGVTLSTGVNSTEWRNGRSEWTVAMAFRPNPKLLLRPGVRLVKSDILALEDGISNPARTQRTNVAQPLLSFSYQPWKSLSVRGDLEHSNNSASYTAITPHSRDTGRLLVRWQPLPNLSVEESLKLNNSSLTESNYTTRIRTTATMLIYDLNERFSAFGGFTYDSYDAAGDVVFARGPAPLTGLINDQSINRIWQAGLEIIPVRRLGIQLTGNYDRTTGAGTVGVEPPAYGPLSWPLVSGTIYYDFPRAGRLSVDLQRTVYREELVTVNNFSANMLTIRFSRGF